MEFLLAMGQFSVTKRCISTGLLHETCGNNTILNIRLGYNSSGT